MAIISILITTAITFAITTGIKLVVKAIAGTNKPDTDSLDYGQTIERNLGLNERLRVLTGKRIVGGVTYYQNTFGAKGEYAMLVVVYNAKPSHAFHTAFLDGEPMSLSGDPTVGEVEITSHFLGKDDVERSTFRLFLGGDNAALGAYLNGKVSSDYDATDNFGDYTVGIWIHRSTNDDIDEDTGESFIPYQGLPEPRLELSGAKVCDPRISGYDYADETTYVYSDNPELIHAQCDYGFYSGEGVNRQLIVGNGYDVALMDIDNIKAVADFCDTNNYTCAGELTSGNADDQIEIRKCYGADLVEMPGRVFTVPQGNRTHWGTVDLTDFPDAKVIDYDREGFSTEVYTEIRGKYSEPTERYGEKDLPAYTNAAWQEANDHIPRYKDYSLFFVTNLAQAARLTKQFIYTSRAPATLTLLNLHLGMRQVPIGDTITLTNSQVVGVNDKKWIVTGMNIEEDGVVDFFLKELPEDEAFAFDAATETPTVPIVTPPTIPWSEWRFPTAGPGVSTLFGRTQYIDADGIASDLFLDGVGSVKNKFEADDDNEENEATNDLTVTLSSSYATASGTEMNNPHTTNSVTVTATGGVAPYTYSWAHKSGATEITVTNASSATTDFEGPAGDSAIKEVTVTDSTSGTPLTGKKTVSVSILTRD